MVPPSHRRLLALSRLLCRYDLAGWATNDSLNPDTQGIIPHLPGHAISGQLLQERVRVELLGRHDPGALPDPGGDQPRGNDRRDPRLIGSGLHPELPIGRFGVAPILDEEPLWLPFFLAPGQDAPPGFTLGPAGQIPRPGSQG